MSSLPYSTPYPPPSPGAFPMPQPGVPQPGMLHPGMLQPEMSPAGVPSYGISVPQSGAPQGKVYLEFVLSLSYLFFYVFNCISICFCY